VTHGEAMVGFGPKQAWLAVREGTAGPAVGALGLRDLGTAPWRAGVDLAHLTDDRVVLTPPLPGAGAHWLLIAGRWLLTTDRLDIERLSATLDTEVQFFSTYRAGERHGWQRAVDGRLVRAFAFVGRTGEVTEWRGTPDPAELRAGLPDTASTPDDDVTVLVSEVDVLRLAAAWSVDPTTLEGRPAPGPLRVAAVGL
jgi:hypothetical protein